MSSKVTQYLGIAVLLLAVAGGVVLQMSCPPVVETTEALTPRGKWIHPKFTAMMNRRMQARHRWIMAKWPDKRTVCGYGPGGGCGSPCVADPLPMPDRLGQEAVQVMKLPAEFQVVR